MISPAKCRHRNTAINCPLPYELQSDSPGQTTWRRGHRLRGGGLLCPSGAENLRRWKSVTALLVPFRY